MKQDGFTEKERSIRFIGRQAGRYALPEHCSNSGISVFACQTQSISPFQVVIAAPVLGQTGDMVSANIDGVGLIKGEIGRIIEKGFSIEVDPELNDLDGLTARIQWLKRRGTKQVEDSRRYKRFRPRNPHSTLLLSDGTQIDCFLIDISRSGAAVSADLVPTIGEPMAVGAMIGRVARTFESGFALKFVDPPKAGELEKLLSAGEIKKLQ